MLHPRKDKLPVGYQICKPCNGTGEKLGRSGKRGKPLACSLCKGQGMVADPDYMRRMHEKAQARRAFNSSINTFPAGGSLYDTDTAGW